MKAKKHLLSLYNPRMKRINMKKNTLFTHVPDLSLLFIITCLLLNMFSFSYAHANNLKTVAILLPEEANDFGWNQQGLKAIQNVAHDLDLQLIIAQGLGYGDIRSTARELIADGAQLLFAHAGGYNTAVAEVAKEMNTPVAIVDQPNLMEKNLIADYTASGHEAAFLAGYLAAKTSRSHILGIVTSGEPPAWNAHSYAFIQGAKYADKSVTIHYAVIGPAAYADVSGAKRVTEAVITTGADVILGQGNGSSFGMLQAIESNKAKDNGKVWFIDVIGDKSPIAKGKEGHLLSSVLWNFEPIFTQIIQDTQNNVLGENAYILSLENQSTCLLQTPHISEEIWQELMHIQDKIIQKEIIVERQYEVDALHKAIATHIIETE